MREQLAASMRDCDSRWCWRRIQSMIFTVAALVFVVCGVSAQIIAIFVAAALGGTVTTLFKSK